jgi:magnesium-transporting ATPase (P-type)
MVPVEIKPYTEFSTSYRIFTTAFLLCFSLLFTYLIIFQIDDIRELPTNGSVISWIKYGITAILDLAIFGIFAFTNYYVISFNFTKKNKKDIIEDSDKTTTKKIYYSIICFAVIGLKIIFSVMASITSSTIKMLKQDSHSILQWILIGFFSIIAICFFLIFRYIIIRFRKANKILETGEMDIFKGIVVDKQSIYDQFQSNSRPGEFHTYNITLDNGKKFLNIKRIFYESVEIGKSVEIHSIPEVGEILHFYVR